MSNQDKGRDSRQRGDYSHSNSGPYKPEPFTEEQKNLIKEYYAKSTLAEKKFFREIFTLIPIDNFEQLIHLFKGGYIVIEDGGTRWQEWANMEGSKPRRSNLQSVDTQYSFQGDLVKECLFGTRMANGHKCTWVQLESYPVNMDQLDMRNLLGHFTSYVLFKLSAKNIGPNGQSVYTEAQPLYLKVPRTRAERVVNAKILENLIFGERHDIPELREDIHAEPAADHLNGHFTPKRPRLR